MADNIVRFLSEIFKDERILTLFVSCFPLIELKGAIPIGLKAGLSLPVSAFLAYLGSTLVCIPLFFLLIPIFNLLKKIKPIKKLVEKIEAVLYGKAEKLAINAKKGLDLKSMSEDEKQKRTINVLKKALLLFVAVPFPVTGVWTGTAIAVFLGLKFTDAIFALSVGNLIAGGIITLLTFIAADYIDMIIYCLMALAIIMLVIFIIKIARSPEKKSEVQDNSDLKNKTMQK